MHRALAPLAFYNTSDEAPPVQFLVLATDGLLDLYDGMGSGEVVRRMVEAVSTGLEVWQREGAGNLALRLLRVALGEEPAVVGSVIGVQSDEAWLDDTSVGVQTL